jgi:membrane protein DedA with SNARE-associated domain
VRAFGPVVAGASPVPRRRFLATSIAGAGLWSASFTLAGYGFARSIGSSLDVAGYAVLALTALAMLVWVLRSRAGSSPRAATERG